MAKNIYSLQLLRNGAAYASKTAAYEALESASGLTNVTKKDGVAVLARYIHTEGEGESQVKQIRTLVGYYAEASAMTETGGAESYMTIIDVEGAAADVEELKARLGDDVTTENTASMQFAALSGNNQSLSGETSVEGAKRYADEKVRAALDALDATTVADENKIVSDVIQTDGQITATAKNVTEVKLAGLSATADTKIASTDTLGDALAKLQGQIDSMDKAAEAVNGQVVTTIAEADGKVTETKANVKDLQLGGYEKDTSATGAIASADTINTALSKLENKVGANKITNSDHSIVVTEPSGTATTTDVKVNINSNEKVIKLDNNGIYTDLDLVKITTGLTANVREKYQLLASDDSKIGVDIEIPKDSALQNFYLGHVDDVLTNADAQGESDDTEITNGTGDTALVYVMQLANGKYKLTAVNVEEFLQESEFADGLQVNNHVVSVKVDASSEKVTTGEGVTSDVLTVSADGVKVANIQNAINYAISTLDATVTGGTTAGTATNDHIQVVVAEADGKLTGVTVTETNIADADDLTALSAKTVTEIASSNNSISATSTAATDGTVSVDLVTDASKIKMTGFTSTDVLSGINATSSVTEAFKEVDKVITENEETVSAALNDLETTKAEKTALEAEIAARKAVDGQNGDTYVANAGAKYISGATSLNDADLKLDAAIANITTGFIEGVQVNGTDLEETNNKVNVQIIAGTTATDTPNAINVATNESTGAITLTLGTLDCGTY